MISQRQCNKTNKVLDGHYIETAMAVLRSISKKVALSKNRKIILYSYTLTTGKKL